MMDRRERKLAVITGASGTFGKAVARCLFDQDMNILLVGRNTERLKTLSDELSYKRKRPNSIKIEICDFDKDEEIESLANRLQRGGIRVDVLCHCAGISRVFAMDKTPTKEWNRLWRINVSSVVLITCRLVPLMTDGAAIVTIGSTAGMRPIIDYSAYTTTKAAVIHFTKAAALELAPRRIRVNCICPGVVKSRIHCETPLGDQELFYESMRLATPMLRLGSPADIVSAVAFLVSDAATWITGAVLTIDGGLSLI